MDEKLEGIKNRAAMILAGWLHANPQGTTCVYNDHLRNMVEAAWEIEDLVEAEHSKRIG